MKRKLWFFAAVAVALVACGGGDEEADGTAGEDLATPQTLAWPNAQSRANSDPWIAAHHDAITVMKPKILAINFVDDANRAGFHEHVDQVVAALREGSRYHGYSNKNATAFLQPSVAKYVDLADAKPVAGWNHKNSTHYPLKCEAGAPYQFDYKALLSPAFTKMLDLRDPSTNAQIDLATAIGKGVVHEIFVHVDGDPDPYTCPNGVKMSDFQMPEVLEAKPKYDAADHPTGAIDPCAGNGCFADDDFKAFSAPMGGRPRSVRITYVNATRGPGCAVHSLGHGWESTAGNGTIASVKTDFRRFANFDLDTRLGLPFENWYACSADDCITYHGENALTWNAQAKTGNVAKYNQGCGAVHFPPNARRHYDDQNAAPVLSTCESFGLAGGKPAPYTDAKSGLYDKLAPDCEGGWQVYWRQSFPGLGNKAKRADGTPMKSWWPYLYY